MRSHLSFLWPRRALWAGLVPAVLLAGVAMLPGPYVRAEESQPFFFLQLTDPQFGMYANNDNFEQETANFEFAIATANRLKPAFVIVTGDLVNTPGNAAQADEYLRIAGKLNRSIPIYHVAGNHDVGNDPTPASLAAYTAKFGPDHYTFRQGNLLGLVLNSNIIRAPKLVAQQAAEQEAWVQAQLEQAKQAQVRHIVVFQHHTWFVKTADEPAQYFNLPLEPRQRLLGLFRQTGVTHIFAGHYHGNVVVSDGALEMVTTGPLGKPLRKDQSGFRVVIVRDAGLEHQYYELGQIPNQIDLKPAKTSTP